MESKNCIICSKKIRRNSKKFCSYSCYGKYRTKTRTKELVCKVCSKTYRKNSYQLKISNKNVCSRKCYVKYYIGDKHPSWRGRVLNKKCLYCNKNFTVKMNSNGQNKKYCSIDCHKKGFHKTTSTQIKLNCVVCNKEFLEKPCHAKNRQYCSYACMAEAYKTRLIGKNNPNFLGGKSFEPYPLGWNKTFKEQIRYRDGYECQICRVPEVELIRKLDVHHIDYDKKNIDPSNLISLCIPCHIKTNGSREHWKQLLKTRS